jgi:hypothetical protein
MYGSVRGVPGNRHSYRDKLSVLNDKGTALNMCLSCQGKSETLGISLRRDEIGYCCPVGAGRKRLKSHLTKA